MWIAPPLPESVLDEQLGKLGNKIDGLTDELAGALRGFLKKDPQSRNELEEFSRSLQKLGSKSLSANKAENKVQPVELAFAALIQKASDLHKEAVSKLKDADPRAKAAQRQTNQERVAEAERKKNELEQHREEETRIRLTNEAIAIQDEQTEERKKQQEQLEAQLKAIREAEMRRKFQERMRKARERARETFAKIFGLDKQKASPAAKTQARAKLEAAPFPIRNFAQQLQESYREKITSTAHVQEVSNTKQSAVKLSSGGVGLQFGQFVIEQSTNKTLKNDSQMLKPAAPTSEAKKNDAQDFLLSALQDKLPQINGERTEEKTPDILPMKKSSSMVA